MIDVTYPHSFDLQQIGRWAWMAEELAAFMRGAIEIGSIDLTRVEYSVVRAGRAFFAEALTHPNNDYRAAEVAIHIIRKTMSDGHSRLGLMQAMEMLFDFEEYLRKLSTRHELNQDDELHLEALATFFTHLSTEDEAASHSVPLPGMILSHGHVAA